MIAGDGTKDRKTSENRDMYNGSVPKEVRPKHHLSSVFASFVRILDRTSRDLETSGPSI